MLRSDALSTRPRRAARVARQMIRDATHSACADFLGLLLALSLVSAVLALADIETEVTLQSLLVFEASSVAVVVLFLAMVCCVI